ncbi:choline ABC transporter ATP-binding protein, partial [Vibrio sp. 10N.222.55.F8]
LNEGILSVKGESALALVKWSESDDLTAINASSVVVASPEIGMRDAIKLKQISNHPILLVEDDLLVGILDNSEFYSALTGNFQLNNAA